MVHLKHSAHNTIGSVTPLVALTIQEHILISEPGIILSVPKRSSRVTSEVFIGEAALETVLLGKVQMLGFYRKRAYYLNNKIMTALGYVFTNAECHEQTAAI